MKRILLLSLFIQIAFTSIGQDFIFLDHNPFGIQSYVAADTSDFGIKYQFIDLDGDQDLDLLTTGMSISEDVQGSFQDAITFFTTYQENIGNKFNPIFSPRKEYNSNFKFPARSSFAIPTFGDLNNDGLVDAVVSSELNIYEEQFLQIHIQQSNKTYDVSLCTDWDLEPFLPYSVLLPELVDLDQDGDLDILMSGYISQIIGQDTLLDLSKKNVFMYAKNIGTPGDPEFLGWFHDPYNLSNVNQSLIAAGDLDLDGDIDILNIASTNEVYYLYYTENLAIDGGKPTFAFASKTVNGVPDSQEDELYLYPSLADIDGDGDLDLFLPVSIDNIIELRFYENISCSAEDIIPTIEINNNILSTTTGNYNYEWINCNTMEVVSTASADVFEVLTNGSYSVKIITMEGCIHESECIEVIVSSSHEEQIIDLNYIPNPTNGQLILLKGPDVIVYSIKVFDSKGQLVGFYNQPQDIDLTFLQSGLYIIQSETNKGIVAQKVVLIF